MYRQPDVRKRGRNPLKPESISRNHQAQDPARQSQQSAKAASVPPAEELRRVAEEVRLGFPRPLRAPQLVLIDVDPRHLHAFWTLEAAAVDAARRTFGGGERDVAMVLRVTEAGDAPGGAFDVEVVGLQGQCYVDIWGEERRYRAELGLRRADGVMHSLAPAALVQLPSVGPAGQAPGRPAETVPPAEAAPAAEVLVPPAGVGLPAATPPRPAAHELPEPVRHPFPLPPTEAGVYDPELRPAVPPQVLAGGQPPPSPAAGARAPMPAAHELPEPVRHPFPLPPTEPGEYAPEDLVGGFLANVPQPPGMPEARTEEVGPIEHAVASAEEQPPAPTAGSDVDPASMLPLENVLTLSSFALGRETVEFEINAELHIVGRVRPGMRLQLFGRPVTLRPDGSFSITRPLPAGALVFSSLLIGDDADPSE